VQCGTTGVIAGAARRTCREAAAYHNVSVVFIEISSQKSIGDTLSILLSKSIADNAVDIRKVASIFMGDNRCFDINKPDA